VLIHSQSHYIGPLHTNEFDLFEIGQAPYNYAAGMDHDGWRIFLPYVIETYKKNISMVTFDGLSAWYRPNPGAGTACLTGGISGNTVRLPGAYPFVLVPLKSCLIFLGLRFITLGRVYCTNILKAYSIPIRI
jgi:hypothetical protein